MVYCRKFPSSAGYETSKGNIKTELTVLESDLCIDFAIIDKLLVQLPGHALLTPANQMSPTVFVKSVVISLWTPHRFSNLKFEAFKQSK